MPESIVPFSLDLAQKYVRSAELFPVDFNDAWQWLDYARKDHGKRAFDKCGFVENLDFQVFLISGENPLGGRPSQIIKLSVECFKTWAMMSQTEKGKQVRLYFLECEKIAKAAIAHTVPQTYAEALLEAGRLALECEKLEKDKARLASKIEQDAPLVKYAETVRYSDTSITFGEFAKIIKNHGGRNTILRKCRDIGVIMKTSTLPYQKFIDAGYFEVGQEVDSHNGRLNLFTLITGKGQIWLHQKLIAREQIQKQVVAEITKGVLNML